MPGELKPDTLPVIATKTLPSALHLPDEALSPTTPSLVLLTSPPDATADPKVILYRLAPASTDLVWEWSPSPPPVPAPTGKLGGLGLKGKAKAQTNGGKVERVEWSPDGMQCRRNGSRSESRSADPSTLALQVRPSPSSRRIRQPRRP